MEDISRELEREIAKAKPSERKKNRNKRVLIVDDYGEMRSGDYLRGFAKFFAVSSMVCALAAGGLYFFYKDLSVQNRLLTKKTQHLEKKYNALVNEKEILMARLVILGKEPKVPGPLADAGKSGAQALEEKPASKERKVPEKNKAVASKAPESVEAATVLPDSALSPSGLTDMDEPGSQDVLDSDAPEENGPGREDGNTVAGPDTEDGQALEKNVLIEKFTLKKDRHSKFLHIGFDIRNNSDKSGGISGRIFTILKPDKSDPSNWLAVPSVPLKNGIPDVYKKGQYFSISHYKPVRFKVESGLSSGEYKYAAVYIFNEDGNLVDETFFDLEQDTTNGN